MIGSGKVLYFPLSLHNGKLDLGDLFLNGLFLFFQMGDLLIIQVQLDIQFINLHLVLHPADLLLHRRHIVLPPDDGQTFVIRLLPHPPGNHIRRDLVINGFSIGASQGSQFGLHGETP